jgi:tryptophan halogenase
MTMTTPRQQAVRSVVILGGGSAGWMTAAALACMLQGRVALTVVESDEIGTVGVGEATIPPITRFNALVGLDDTEFLRETRGTFKLGIEFIDWTRPGERYMHGFGTFAQQMQLARFEDLWVKLFARGQAEDIGAYLITRQAAAADRYQPARLDLPDSPLSHLAHAYHFDAGLYARLLRRHAEAAGVTRIEGRVTDVLRGAQPERIAALRLASGRLVEGDFFIDCSGFRGRLIEDELHAGYEDWSEWLLCDRAVAVPCERTEPLHPCTRATARPAGWPWRIPLQHRTGNGHVHSSRHVSEDEATALLMANLDGAPLAEPRTLRFVPGMRRRAWVGNCLAIGLAAGFLEPLESTSIHLVQTAVLRLVRFFPSREFAQPDIDEFNRLTRREFEHVRDFVIAHYHLTQRDDTPFWRHCRSMAVPPTLQRRLDLFASHGRIVPEQDDLFVEMNWLQVLHGQGVKPAGHHPLVDLANTEEVCRYLERVRSDIARSVAQMPGHAEYIDRLLAGA